MWPAHLQGFASLSPAVKWVSIGRCDRAGVMGSNPKKTPNFMKNTSFRKALDVDHVCSKSMLLWYRYVEWDTCLIS